jgi:MFS family permease
MILVAAQVLDGVSGTILGVLTALIVADLTKGTGRFNLAQGFVGTMSGVGASLSTTLSSLVAGSLGRRISRHLGSGPRRCAPAAVADARDHSSNENEPR